MSLLSEAHAILRSAEQGLRVLMEKAIQAGQYADVARLAAMAQALGGIVRMSPDAGIAHDSSEHAQPRSRIPAGKERVVAKTTTKKPSTAIYPRFEVDRDRLVKIGWSKREKAEYEHYAPRETARNLYMELGKAAAQGAFRMEELFPITLVDGSEVPSYQAYLVLAWLRHIALIEKLGKDSYQWLTDDITESSFRKSWEAMPRRGMQARGKTK